MKVITDTLIATSAEDVAPPPELLSQQLVIIGETHAPNRLYLPSEITITRTHGDSLSKFSYEKVSYEYEVNKMNISFTKLREEECEVCLLYNEHKHEANG